MITVKQAAKIFKVTERTIYNWVMADNIKCKNALYSADDLQRAYDKRRRKKPRLRHK